MSKAPRTPYQRTMTPTEKGAMKKRIQIFVESMNTSSEGDAKAAEGGEKVEEEPWAGSGTPSGRLGNPGPRLGTENVYSRPSSSTSVTSFSMPRPASKLSRLRGLPGDAQSASCPGPLSDLKAKDAGRNIHTPASSNTLRVMTPSLRHPLRSDHALPLISSDLLTPPVGAAPSRPGTCMSVQSGTRAGVSNPIVDGTMSRGKVYSVFHELDPFLIGKITRSKFQEASVAIGLKEDQGDRFFDKLDPEGKGFITLDAWRDDRGMNSDLITNFTRMYLSKTKGKDRVDWDNRQSLAMAMELAVTKMQLKALGKVIPYSRLLDAFTFMDVDKSGALDAFEIQDAFHGMGINITPEVAAEAMRHFDKNGDGVVDYQEFGRTIFPLAGRGYT
eukprot:gene31541-6726_t